LPLLVIPYLTLDLMQFLFERVEIFLLFRACLEGMMQMAEKSIGPFAGVLVRTSQWPWYAAMDDSSGLFVWKMFTISLWHYAKGFSLIRKLALVLC
jgi:hypothetical protein